MTELPDQLAKALAFNDLPVPGDNPFYDPIGRITNLKVCILFCRQIKPQDWGTDY